MATAPKYPQADSVTECLAEREFLRCKTQAQVLSIMEVIEHSKTVIRESKTMLDGLRSRIDETWER